MTRPRIGLNCDLSLDSKPKCFLYASYLEWVVQAGGTPVMLPAIGHSLELLEVVDALLLTGGDDYRFTNPIGQIPEDFTAVAKERETFDRELAARALSTSLPVLGICGGFQLLVGSAGGQLYGDLPSEFPASEIQHRRSPSEEGPLAEHGLTWHQREVGLDIAAGEHRINSHHHQGVRAVPSDWRVLASAPDELIEAARGPGSFQVGVQWHPEKNLSDPLSQALAQALVLAAKATR